MVEKSYDIINLVHISSPCDVNAWSRMHRSW